MAEVLIDLARVEWIIEDNLEERITGEQLVDKAMVDRIIEDTLEDKITEEQLVDLSTHGL